MRNYSILTKSITPVQKVTNTSANYSILILDYDWWKDNEKFCKQMISCKTMTEILHGNFEKMFSRIQKMTSRKIFRHFLQANFFMLMLFGYLQNTLPVSGQGQQPISPKLLLCCPRLLKTHIAEMSLLVRTVSFVLVDTVVDTNSLVIYRCTFIFLP